MSDSLIRAAVERLHAYVPGEQPTDPEILKLNTNENPYPPSPAVAAALANQAERFRLYPDPVCMRLREAIAELHGVTAAQVIIGNGSDETLAMCTRSFVEADGEIAWFEPSYSLYPVLTDIQDVRCRTIPLNEDFTWTVPEQLDVDLFFLTNPNAPTSLTASVEQVRALCAAVTGVVVIDEAYADFAPAHCMALVSEFDNVLVMRTFSKSYSLAGLRAGYAVGAPQLIEAMYKIKDSYNMNLLTQVAAEAAIRDQAYLQDVVARIKQTRERTADTLRERGWEVIDSSTNFVFAKPTTSAAELFAALREQKVIVRYFPGPVTGDYLRITIGTDAQMDRFLASI